MSQHAMSRLLLTNFINCAFDKIEHMCYNMTTAGIFTLLHAISHLKMIVLRRFSELHGCAPPGLSTVPGGVFIPLFTEQVEIRYSVVLCRQYSAYSIRRAAHNIHKTPPWEADSMKGVS